MKRAKLKEIINSTADEVLQGINGDNPLETWTTFIDRLDAKVRRQIGNSLAANGMDRYTGEPLLKNGGWGDGYFGNT